MDGSYHFTFKGTDYRAKLSMDSHQSLSDVVTIEKDCHRRFFRWKPCAYFNFCIQKVTTILRHNMTGDEEDFLYMILKDSAESFMNTIIREENERQARESQIQYLKKM